MSVTRRLMGWLMLVLSLGGCSSYRVVSHSGLNDISESVSAKEVLPEIEIGDLVRIELVEGEEVEGRVSAISSDSITLKDDNEIGNMEMVVIRFGGIVSIEKRFASPGRTLALVVVVFGAFIGIVAAGESANPR